MSDDYDERSESEAEASLLDAPKVDQTPEPEPPKKPVRLRDMTYFLEVEAEHIRIVQRHLVSSGTRSEPYAGEIQRAEVYEATARFLKRIEPILGKVIDLLKSDEEQRRGRAKGKVRRGGA